LFPAEKLLLALIVEGKEGIADALRQLATDDREGLRSAEILKAATEAVEAGRPISLTTLEAGLGEEDATLLHRLAVESVSTGNVDPAECVRELRAVRLRTRMAAIQKDLGRATGAAEEALLEEKLSLKRKIASL
jgi:hypothetical protein